MRPLGLGCSAQPASAGLLRAEDTVARIAQTGQDVAVVIELAVNGGSKDLDVRMRCVQGVNALGHGQQAQKLDGFGLAFLEPGNRCIACRFNYFLPGPTGMDNTNRN